MDVFITWSGPASKILAEGLRTFAKRVIQASQPFLSSEDIRKGSKWATEIGQRLEKTHYGIVCLTRSNLKAPWVNFEAGAISKHTNGCVTTVLLDVASTDVDGPLAQFQHAEATKKDITRLFTELNELFGEKKLEGGVLGDSIERFWPELDNAIAAAKQQSVADANGQAVPVQRPTQELLAELLAISRENGQTLESLVSAARVMPVTFGGVGSSVDSSWQDSFAKRLSALDHAQEPSGR